MCAKMSQTNKHFVYGKDFTFSHFCADNETISISGFSLLSARMVLKLMCDVFVGCCDRCHIVVANYKRNVIDAMLILITTE